MNLGQNPQILLFLFLNASLKARDQKQIYRLKETMSHWGSNPPPLAE